MSGGGVGGSGVTDIKFLEELKDKNKKNRQKFIGFKRNSFKIHNF